MEMLIKVQGLDLSRVAQIGQFSFVDCFSNPALTLEVAEKNILSTLDRLQTSAKDERPRRITLILDAPDVVLASTATTAVALNRFLLSLRSHDAVQNTIISLSADLPLLSAASPDDTGYQPTPIEVETAAFLTTQAHAAQWVLSVRGLDTGAATDVSGVLRATRGGDYSVETSSTKECELLYLLNRDGSVKVFERGSSGQ
jgi:elongator complex protein 6